MSYIKETVHEETLSDLQENSRQVESAKKLVKNIHVVLFFAKSVLWEFC